MYKAGIEKKDIFGFSASGTKNAKLQHTAMVKSFK